jgi:hypothetical protein
MLLATLLALGLGQEPTASEGRPVELGEVEVLGQRTTPDPFDIFQALCLDANRIDRRAFRPDGTPRWSRLPTAAGASAVAPETFVRRDGDLEMVLRIEEGPDQEVERVQTNACSLTLAGPHDQDALVRGMTRALGGAGTSRHLSLRDAYPTFPGWTQLFWAGMPDRNTSNWRALLGEDRRQSAVLLIAQPSFYRQYSYVVAELRFTDQAPRPMSHLSLVFRTRPPND